LHRTRTVEIFRINPPHLGSETPTTMPIKLYQHMYLLYETYIKDTNIISNSNDMAKPTTKTPLFTTGKSLIALVNLVTLFGPYLADWK
jgi:hypothetical protein